MPYHFKFPCYAPANGMHPLQNLIPTLAISVASNLLGSD